MYARAQRRQPGASVSRKSVGTETVTPSEGNNRQSSSLTFYGSSFLTDATGKILAQGSREQEEILLAEDPSPGR